MIAGREAGSGTRNAFEAALRKPKVIHYSGPEDGGRAYGHRRP